MLNRECKAKDPSKCRFHGQKQNYTKQDLNTATTYAEYEHIRSQLEKTNSNLSVSKVIELDDTFYLDGSKDNGEWQQGWFKDKEGNPVSFVKIHVHDEKDSLGNLLASGVFLCDVEVNPAYRGTNAPLATFRKIKELFNVEQVWVGDDFSKLGLAMYKRLRKHEELTGETTLKLKPYLKESNLDGYNNEYTFVEDWVKLIPKYRL